ncbi:MAG: Ig-like domain-containing protein [Spirochaetia bacterium]|nr:Ig-like domain-containing protein [Spirochaetia bacterium]
MKFLTVLALIFLYQNCSGKEAEFFFLPESARIPEVILTYPENSAMGVPTKSEIKIQFSQPMDKEKTQSALLLSGPEGRISGNFLWQGNLMIFTPSSQLKLPGRYTSVIQRSAESNEGVNIKSDFTFYFHTVTDIMGPSLISSSPSDSQTGVSPGIDLSLEFSEAINRSTIFEGIKITPSFLFTVLDSQKNRILIRPVYDLKPGQYTIHINSHLKDLSGNSLRNSRSIVFTVGSDFYPPEIISVRSGKNVLNEGLFLPDCSKNSPLFIEFSEAMDPSSEKGIKLFPPSPFSSVWVQNNILQVNFNEPLLSNTYYTVLIDQNAKDASFNPILNTESYGLITNADDSSPPYVVDIMQTQSSFKASANDCSGITPSSAFTPNSPLENYSVLDLSQFFDMDPSSGQNCVLELTIQFSKPMLRNSFLPPVTSFESIIDTWNNNFTIQDIIVSETGETVRVRFNAPVISGNESTPVHRFRIRGGRDGVQDSSHNYMEQDFNLIFTF